jgi:type III secretion protein T
VPDSNLVWSFFAPILLALPRVGAALAIAPLFPSSVFPMLLRSAVAVALALFLYPHMSASMPATTQPELLWLGLIAKETFIGALLGLAVGTLVWALEGAGTLIDFQVGFLNAQYFDPFGGHDTGPMAQLMLRLGIMLFVAAGGLQILTALLFESFQLWPVSAFFPSTARLADFAGTSFQSLLELLVHCVAPVLLLLALIDLGFGLVGRVVPQLNVFFFTFPIKAALAALMIALYLSYLSDLAHTHLTALRHWLEHLGPVLAPH